MANKDFICKGKDASDPIKKKIETIFIDVKEMELSILNRDIEIANRLENLGVDIDGNPRPDPSKYESFIDPDTYSWVGIPK